MLKFTVLLVSVIFLDFIYAAPTPHNTNGCKQECPTTSKGSKLNYLPGQVYTYSFDSNVAISLTGNDPQDIQLQIQGQARIHGLTANCQYGLDLQDIVVLGPDSSKKRLDESLQLSKLVRFTLADDTLEPEICADASDTDVSLNIKRAIISLLQTNDAQKEETDIFGTCPTNYAVAKQDDGTQIVTKTRDLNACSHRESLLNGLVTGVFNENSGIKSTPLLNGDYTNELRINKDGIIESAQVIEDYTLVPFTNAEAGVKARVVTKLRLKGQKAGASTTLSVSVPRTLVFENPDKPTAANIKTANNALKNTYDTYNRQNSVGAQAANQFTELIRVLRHIKKDDLLSVMASTKKFENKDLSKKIYLDALFRVGTSDSVSAIATLLIKGKIDEAKRLAYLSFNLATDVNKETIIIIRKLLDSKDLPKEAYLSIGNLIKKFCQKNPCDDPELLALLDKLAEKLGNCKSETHQQEDTIVAILKGLRSAKSLSGPIVNSLSICLSADQSTRVRSAAIQAFASAACDNQVQEKALELLKNLKEDAEIRIEAYLSLVECPNAKIANSIKNLLENENVFQVGSFITTHLANLRASTDLHREKARVELADIYTSKKFPHDLRKFSFNHEVSYEFGSLGLGASTDTNVIYSQKSFLPRSIRTNFTGELFGTSFNILELSGRQENVDLLLERYFGPKGYFRTLNKQEAISKLMHTLHSGDDKRTKRGLREDAQQFDKQHINDVNRDIDLDVSVKMFGSELYFLSLEDNFPLDAKDFTRTLHSWFERFLKRTKDGNKNNFNWHSLFLDAEFSYPTSAGLPLKIQAQGAGAIHLETELKVDLKDIKANPQNTAFSVSCSPSYNVELTGILSIDGHVVKTGVKVSSNLHSSTGSTLAFSLLEQGKGVDLKIEFPFKKQELFSFDHKIVFIEQNLGYESVQHNLKATTSAQKKDAVIRNDCFDQFNKYLGVTICYKMSHNLFKKGEKLANTRLFPLSGPAHVSAYIEIDKQYTFKALLDDSNPNRRALELTFNTPDSNPNRKVTVKVEGAISPKIYASASLVSPYKAADAEIGFNNDNTELSVYGKANGGSEQHLVKLGFKKGGSGTRREYTPIIEYNRPEAIPYRVSGKVIADSSQSPKTRYTFENLRIEPVQNDAKLGPLTLNGWVEHEKASNIATSLEIKYKDQSGKIDGNLITKPQQFDLDFSIVSDFDKLANGKIQLGHKRSDKQFKNSLVLVYGADLQSTTKRIELSQDYEYEHEDKKLKSLNVKNSLEVASVPLKLVVNGGIRKNHLDYEVLVEYVKGSLASNLVADCNRKSQGDWSVDLDIAVNKHKLECKSVRDIDDAAQKSSVKSELKTSFGAHVELNTKFDNVLTRQKADVTVDGSAVLARDQQPYKLNYKLLVTPKHGETNGNILAGSNEVLAFNAVLNRNGGDQNVPTDATLDLTVNDLVTARGKYNSLKGAGKSELIVSLPRIDRKVKIDSKYEYTANKFDLRDDFYYDFEKDNTKHISFETKNKYTASSFDSVNELDVNGEKIDFNIDYTRTGDMKNGKANGQFLLRLPTQREITGKLDRTLDLVSPKATGHGNIKITDTLGKAGKKSRSIEIDGTLKEGNRELRLFDLLHKITLTDFDGKQIVIDTNFKHLPKGDYKTALVALNIYGAIPNAIEVSVGADEYCPVHAVYRVTLKHGNNVNINLDGDYAVGERGRKPSTFKLNGQVSIPQSKFKQLTFGTRGSLKQPELDDAKGQYEYDFKVTGKSNENDVAIHTKGKAGKNGGDTSLNIKLPETDPFALDLGYMYDSQAETLSHQASGNVQIRYGNGKNIKFSGEGNCVEGKEASIHATITTPYEKAKSLEITFKTEKKEENSYANEAELVIDNKKYKLTNSIVVSRLNPSINIDFYYPQNGHSQISASVNRLNDRKYKASLHVVNINGFSLAGDSELSYQSVENFGLIFDLDSEALKAKKLHIDIHSKQNGNNKGVEFTATEQDKNIVSGYADYQIKEEKGKTTIEGKGNVNWYDKTSVVTFQFMKNDFDQTHHNETGVMLVFNGQVGPKNIAAQIKVTNKNFHIKHTICEDGTPCINISVGSSLSDLDVNRFTHNLLVTIDLRKLGFAHEFNLKSETKRDGWIINHTLDMHLQAADQSKYQYLVYVSPSSAGVVLTIPKRISAIEVTYVYPKNYIGRYQATITSYLDKKNHPEKRSTIGFTGDIKRQGKATFAATGTLTASHPSVKELKITGESILNGDDQSISGLVKIDVFKATNQAIIISGQYANTDRSNKAFNITSDISLKSTGLGLNYVFRGNAGASWDRRRLSFTSELIGPTANERNGIYLLGDEHKIDLSLVAFNEELLQASSELDTNKRTLAVQSLVKLLGSDSINSKAKLSLSGASAQIVNGRFLTIDAQVAAGKEISFKAVGNDKQLLNIKIALDQANLLSTDYDVNDKEFKEFLKNAKAKVAEDSKRARNELESRLTQAKQSLTKQVNVIKENLPDFSRLSADYKQEFEQFTDDLLSDKSIKELVEFIKNTYGILNKSIGEILRTLVENFNKISKIINDLFKQLYDGFNERILPSLKESYNHIEQSLSNLYDETINAALHVFERLIETLKKFEEDFKKIGQTASEWFRKVAKAIDEQWKIVERELKDLYKLVVDHLKSLPGIESIKEKYNEILNNLVVPENIINTLRELAETLKHALQIKELNELINSVIDYAEKKLQKQPVDDGEALKKIAVQVWNTLKSLLKLAREQLGAFGDEAYSDDYWGLPIPTSIQKIQIVPQLSTLKLSVWNYIRYERLPSVKDLILAYRPHAFNPLNLFPPFLIEGRIIDGQYLFTFDGDLITLPGSCQYVVARDIVDGNFTVVAQIADGKLKSIAIVDKSGDSIEVNDLSKVTVNDRAAELPVHEKTLHAWRTYYSVSILSNYGVLILCKLDLKTCHVDVNGFYHSKLNGLLGNGNYEQYDDTALPNGKLSKSATEFVNAYKLQPSCPDVTISEQHKHGKDDAKSAECNNVFESGTLRLCGHLIDATNYIEACQHAVNGAANKQEAACTIGFGYASQCRRENILVNLPALCQKCEVTDDSGAKTEHGIGEQYTPAPAKKADIILIVDTAIESATLTDLVQTLINDMRQTLKKSQINDANINVIGYKKGETYLNHYTSDGKLDITRFHLTKKPENAAKDEKIVNVGCHYLDPLLDKLYSATQQLQDDLSLAADGRAFREALSYPFRSNANKVIIAIRSDVLTHSSNPIKLIGARAANEVAKLLGLSIHMIAPTPELKFDNQKDAKNVVGFNDKTVLQLGGAKKRTHDQRQHLQYGHDLGIDIVQGANKGYVFSLSNYNSLESPKERKQFLNIASNAIATQIVKADSVTECTCVLHKGLYVREACRETDKINKTR